MMELLVHTFLLGSSRKRKTKSKNRNMEIQESSQEKVPGDWQCSEWRYSPSQFVLLNNIYHRFMLRMEHDSEGFKNTS